MGRRLENENGKWAEQEQVPRRLRCLGMTINSVFEAELVRGRSEGEAGDGESGREKVIDGVRGFVDGEGDEALRE